MHFQSDGRFLIVDPVFYEAFPADWKHGVSFRAERSSSIMTSLIDHNAAANWPYQVGRYPVTLVSKFFDP